MTGTTLSITRPSLPSLLSVLSTWRLATSFTAPGPRFARRAGLRWGLYPQRADAQAAWFAPWWSRLRLHAVPREKRLVETLPVRAHQQAWLDRAADAWVDDLADLRARLASGRAGAGERDEALGAVAAACLRVLARDPFDEQLLCAQVLCDGQLAEMATGEGKTLAIGLAALVCAMAGAPVHVLTANDYLAQRDAQALQPLAAALGLSVGVVTAGLDPAQRRRAYGCAITYATAREVAFDHLRDGLALRGGGRELQRRAAALAGDPAPSLLLRGLCVALVDEADSLLIDEATMPLVLAEPDDDPAQRAACFQALALARELRPEDEVSIDAAGRAAHWTPAGQARVQALSATWGAAWLNRRHREDLVAQALVALHALQRDVDYLVDDGLVELIDAVTGRRAAGRVWSRQLHMLVELKEGCRPSAATRTAAQTSFQRFFARYLHLAGTSGTLAECRAELAAVYGLALVRIPLRRPGLREIEPPRVWADATALETALVDRVRGLQAQGRPVLIGVDSLERAATIAAALAAAGVSHQRLDAAHDAHEAAVVAAAGQPGAVTVATAMAGRGTDVALGPGVAAAGGLHVIDLHDGPCARTHRQLVGRCARQGDPGSAERWFGPAADASAFRSSFALQAASRLRQHLHGWYGRRQRQRLLEQDLTWQQKLAFHARHAA